MDKFQAAFEILYFLSAVDGNVDEREIKVINDFLSSNYGNIKFDPPSVLNSINTLTGKGMVDELIYAAQVFKNNSNASDRTVILDFALELIASDGDLNKPEAELFNVLGTTWDIDMQRYVQSRLG
jgi:uncharacterized tellurite resistance protein B-like protein